MEKARTIDGQYKIVHPIKKGGFGIVYFGWDLFLDKPIAIKEVLPDLLGEAKTIDMFRDEAVNTAKLTHQNIVQIYNLRKTSDNKFFMIMEYIDGIDLRRLIERCREYKKPVPFELVSYIISEICKALEYAHSRRDVKTNEPLNIIHRDVSPSNIMITSEGIIKLIDFGIAKARFRRSETRQGLIKGKISYISPEQILGEEIDRRSDLFSLGVLFYELLTMAKPFQGNSDYTILQAIVKCNYSLKQLKEREVPLPLIEIVQKCLKNKEERYDLAKEIYYDIDKFLITQNRQDLEKNLNNFIYELFYDEIKKQYTIYSKAVEEEVVEEISTNDITHETPRKKQLPESEKPVVIEEEPSAEKIKPGEYHDEKTIADIIRLADRSKKRHIMAGLGIVFLFSILFLIFDSFFQWTPIGIQLYNKFNPPLVEIHSFPQGSKVFVDGNPVQKVTPLRINKITPGSHKIELKLSGYPSIVRSFHITPTEKQGEKAVTKRLTYRFETVVRIESTPPNAEVWLSDIKSYPQRTPCELTCQVGDTLSLRLVKEDLLPADNLSFFTSTREINDYNRKTWSVEDEKIDNLYNLKIHATFAKLISIQSIPSGAEIYLDEESTPLGKTNLKLPVTVGEHTIKIKNRGYIPEKKLVSVNESTDKIIFDLFRSVKINVVSLTDSKKDVGATINYIRPYRSRKSSYRRLKTPAVVNLKSQRYTLSLTKTGFIDTVFSFKPTSSNAWFKMRPANPVIQFTVLDKSSKKPIQNCIIRYRSISSGSTKQTLRVLGKTDNSGIYKESISPGRYEIQFDKSGCEINSITADVNYISDNKKVIYLERFR
jgi:serine/threonine protein kinase